MAKKKKKVTEVVEKPKPVPKPKVVVEVKPSEPKLYCLCGGELILLRKVANQTDGEAKKVLNILARWEMGHEQVFNEYHDKLLQVVTF